MAHVIIETILITMGTIIFAGMVKDFRDITREVFERKKVNKFKDR